MDRALFDLLLSGGAPSAPLLWGLLQEKERSLERACADCERERTDRVRERTDFERERAAAARERDLLAEVERMTTTELRHQLNLAQGLLSVRSVLEKIVLAFAPAKSATKALDSYVSQEPFLAYLGLVCKSTGYSVDDLLKSAKAAYSVLSETTHHGSTLLGTTAEGVPQAILGNKCMLFAVASIFKFAKHDIRFYVADASDVLALPSPARTPPSSAAPSASPSAATTPPQAPRVLADDAAQV